MSIEDVATGDRIGHVPDDPTVEQNGGGQEDDRSLLLNQLRQMHEANKTRDYKLDLEIPGFKGLLIARFRPYDTSKSEKKADVLRKRFEAGDAIMLDAACDTLADACSEILVRKTRQDELMPLDDEEPVTFSPRLGELLGFDARTPRGVIKKLFPTEQAIVALAMQVNNWLADVTKEVDEEFLGE